MTGSLLVGFPAFFAGGLLLAFPAFGLATALDLVDLHAGDSSMIEHGLRLQRLVPSVSDFVLRHGLLDGLIDLDSPSRP